MLTDSNIFAAVAVILLPFVGLKCVALKLRSRLVCASIGGIPYLVGQVCQACQWWPIWVQYHLLDGSYMLWGTGVVLTGPFIFLGLLRLAARLRLIPEKLYSFAASMFDKIPDKVLLVSCFMFISLLGIGTELWDSYQKSGSLTAALDWGDCIAFSIGGAVTLLLHILLEQVQTNRRVLIRRG